jgi:hypothetical protein
MCVLHNDDDDERIIECHPEYDQLELLSERKEALL